MKNAIWEILGYPKKNKILHINSFGEEIREGSTIYYYNINEENVELEKVENVCQWETEYSKAVKDTWAKSSLTPAGALIYLNEYYEEFGYTKKIK